MKETSSNVPFFEYFENHFEWHKKNCVVTKTNWMKEDTKEVVRSMLSGHYLMNSNGHCS